VILLDTTVLVYALGSDHPLREPCRAVISAIGEGRLSATTTVEVIQEFAHVRARRRGRADAASLAARYATLLAPLVSLDTGDLADGLRLFRDEDRLGSFDAVLAAAAMRREHITSLLSADRAFADIDSLAHIDPSDPELPLRLGL
jgi:predicted nucleic acid-binding protein